MDNDWYIFGIYPAGCIKVYKNKYLLGIYKMLYFCKSLEIFCERNLESCWKNCGVVGGNWKELERVGKSWREGPMIF